MSNNNYYVASRGFAETAFFEAADAGAFNAVGDGGCFAAFCTFAVRSSVQVPGGSPVAIQYLFGNSVDAAFSGWSFELLDVAGELVLQAKVGNGAAYVTATETLTGSTGGAVASPGIMNRIIHATMWLDGTNLILATNGTICLFTAFDPATLAPSGAPATIGAGGAATPNNNPAMHADIFSCGYSSDFPGLNVGGNAEFAMGFSFEAAQEGFGSGFITQAGGIDWTHRYDMRTLAPGRVGSISKTAAGAAGLPPVIPAGSVLADVGGAGRGNTAPYSPVNMTRGPLGGANNVPVLVSRKNADWANVGTFFFTP